MAKKPTKVEKEEIGTQDTPVVAPKVERRVRPEQLTVTLADGSYRTYSPKTHGKVWEALANNYANANKGSVIE